MIRYLYSTAALFLLGGVEGVLDYVEKVLVKLDKVIAHAETVLEQRAVKLAEAARDRREALDSINTYFDRIDAKLINSITDGRTAVQKAQEARSKVSEVVNVK